MRRAYIPDPDAITLHLCRGDPPPPLPLYPQTQPALPPAATLSRRRRRVSVCVHQVLRADTAAPNARLRPEWLEAFFRHYSALGAEHFFLYASRVPFVDVPGYSYDWMDVTWMHGADPPSLPQLPVTPAHGRSLSASRLCSHG